MGSPRCRAPCLSGAALKRLISEWRRKMRFGGGVLSSWLHLRLWDVTVCGLLEKLWWRECAWKPFYTVCLRGNAKSSMKALQWKWKRLVYDGGKHNFILFSEETWENDEGTVLLLLLVFLAWSPVNTICLFSVLKNKINPSFPSFSLRTALLVVVKKLSVEDFYLFFSRKQRLKLSLWFLLLKVC